jgi:cytochrome P450
VSALPPGPRTPLQTLGFWARPLSFLERCRARYGPRFTLRLLGSPPMVMVSDPEEIKQVFTAPADVLHPGEGARLLESVVGPNSVILLDEGAHMEQRKLILPAFHGERMEALAGVVQATADAEVASWPTGEPVPLQPRLQALTLEVILRAVFGLDPGRRLDVLRERLRALLEWGASPFSVLPEPALLAGRGPWGRFQRRRAAADEALYELIEERRASGEEGDDVFSMLLAARHSYDGSPMTREELRDELMTLLVAGHETTASGLSWAFERLARHPHIVERLAADEGDEYLTATVHETLRRRPVIPNAAPRLVKQPVEIGGITYPPGVAISPNAYLVQHDPAIYPEPYAFRPERFLGVSPGTYTWIPFGGGRRRCIGASFAMLEMKTVLRAVIARYALAPAHDGLEPPKRRSITVHPAAGADLVLRQRASSTTASTSSAITMPEPVISSGR